MSEVAIAVVCGVVAGLGSGMVGGWFAHRVIRRRMRLIADAEMGRARSGLEIEARRFIGEMKGAAAELKAAHWGRR